MTPEEEIVKLKEEIDALKYYLEMHRKSTEFAWAAASRLAKEVLKLERRYIPQFLFPPDGKVNDEEYHQLFSMFLSFLKEKVEK
jgi:hypothetical protein